MLSRTVSYGNHREEPAAFDARFYFEYCGDRIIIRTVPPTEKLNQLPAMLMRWEQLAQELSHPHMELTVEEFAMVLSTFREIQRSGVLFDPVLTALIGLLERQAFGRDDDEPLEDDDPSGGEEWLT